jgi:hypothetical protein
MGDARTGKGLDVRACALTSLPLKPLGCPRAVAKTFARSLPERLRCPAAMHDALCVVVTGTELDRLGQMLNNLHQLAVASASAAT